MENIFAAIFEVESEAYQAFTEIKNHMLTKNYIIPRMVLIKKEGNRIIPCDGYDEKAYSNDTELGGIIGMFVGILGEPLGILLGGAGGALIGGALDAKDLKKAASLITKVTEIFKDGDVGLIAIVQENEGGEFERELTKYKTVIHKKDAAEVAVEVAEAAILQEKLAQEAKERMRQDKIDSIKEKIETKRAELQKEFKAIREGIKIVHDEIEERMK